MKEASGELNMTLITIVAIALIAGLFAILYPQIRNAIAGKWSGAEAELNGLDNEPVKQQGGTIPE